MQDNQSRMLMIPHCIISLEKSKPGKHGSAKARIVAVGLFDNVKRSIVSPVSQRIEMPIIDKRDAQVLSVSPSSVMLMDMESYETFEIDIPKEEEIATKLEEGKEVEYWIVVGRKKVTRVK